MIYFISGQTRMFEDGDIKSSTIEECLNYFKDEKLISVDTETTGFDAHKDRILSIQLGDYRNQFVIDCTTVSIEPIKNLLESKLLLFHNAKFDLRFLYKNNIYPQKIYDTFLAECILTTGLDTRELSLKGVGIKYCNVALSKEIRGQIHREGLSDRVIEYGANDVKYLQEIRNYQIVKIEELGLTNVLNLENEVVKVFAGMEYRGVPFNSKKWKEVSEIVKEDRRTVESKLDEYIYALGTKQLPEHNNFTKYCVFYKQGSLFEEFETETRKCNINWASNKQKLDLLNVDLGIETDSVDDRALQKIKKRDEIVPMLIEHSKIAKLDSSFGLGFLKLINPITNRVHPEYWQILSTGRISVSNPNVNQIPSKGKLAKTIRSAFEAPEGYKIVGGDYGQYELRIIAELSQDPLWLEAFRSGQDLHSVLCAKTFNIPIEDVKKPFLPKPENSYRDVQKTISFGLSYGMSEYKLADTMQIEISQAREIIKKFFSIVPDVKRFLEGIGRLGANRGYIKTAPPYSRIRWFEKHKGAVQSQDRKVLGEIERASKNLPIQGTNADLIKEALINVQNVIDDNNYPAEIILSVYDEIQTVCREDFAEEWKDILQETMIQAAKTVIKSIPVVVDVSISDCWTK